MRSDHILVKPLVTEKTTQLQAKGVYGFEVHAKANKHQITEQIEKIFKVEVEHVRIMVRKGKVRRVGKMMKAKAVAPRKIAYITVSKGTINVFPSA